MAGRVSFRKDNTSVTHPDAYRLKESAFSRYILSRLAEVDYPVTCDIQIDDTRDTQHDFTQLWLSRPTSGRWSPIFRQPVPHSSFDGHDAPADAVSLFDEFFAAFRAQQK